MITRTIIIGILIAGGVGWFLVRSHKPPMPTPTPIPVPTQEISSDFSLRTPEGYKLFSPSENIFTIENSDGRGFQIFVSPFDEPGPITAERIRQDEPDAVIDQPGQAKLDGAMSFVFYGHDEDLGDTFEVWTVAGGKLYQIMGKKSDEKLITETINTWKWK